MPHEEWARLEAAHLILSGADLPLAGRPTSPGAVNRELERIMSSDSLWSQAPALFPAGPAAHAAVLDGFSIAYCMLGDGAVLVAAAGVGPDRFRLRKVRDWAAYDYNATTTFPLSDLKATAS